jgi:hypothetical protein
VFGYYPKSVGSWYIDEVTLAYMADKYGIVASCNCKDQIGTDGYTLWGGYWNQAYYPSRLNAYMPAQNEAGQINVPVFRMLGSDPIYQFGAVRGMYTLEPVYPRAGGSADWVRWFMDVQTRQPCLEFNFAQAGQENSFGWDAMKKGLTLQAEVLSKASKAGEIRVETLAEAGEWFRDQYPVTPATCVVALDDWKHQDRKSVWYESRYYRINFFWESGGFFVRDLHCFDQSAVSSTHDTPLTKSSLVCGTLPVMDTARWAGAGHPGMRPVLVAADGTATPMTPDGRPVVKPADGFRLNMTQKLTGGGTFSTEFRENGINCSCTDGQGKPVRWAWELTGGADQKAVVQDVTPDAVSYRCDGVGYQVRVEPNTGACERLADGTIRITADETGKMLLYFGGR